jgi:hypothetical protein
MLVAGAYTIHFMVAHQFLPGPELNTFLPKGNFRGTEVHLILMDHPTTIIKCKIIYDVHGAGLYGIRLTRTYGEKTVAPASRMKKQRNKNRKKKNFCGQHCFTHQYGMYNSWKELEKLQEGLEVFMEVMNAFLSVEKLIDDEEIITLIVQDKRHSSPTKFPGTFAKKE